MKTLTEKEEELMCKLWDGGPMFVRELVECHPEPRPHFNTVSTFIRILEQKGFVGHEKVGGSYRYYPVVTREQYSKSTLKAVVKRYFNNSFLGVISTLVKNENLSDAEVEQIIDLVRKGDAAGSVEKDSNETK